MEGPYRLIVVHSSKLDKRKANKLEKGFRLGKRQSWKGRSPNLGLWNLHAKPDAQAALNRLRQECSGLFYDVSGNVEAEEVVLKRARRGQAQKGRKKLRPKLFGVQRPSVGPLNEELTEHAKQKASCFVLITNIT